MHDHLETQQQHKNENDAKVDVDGEVDTVAVEREKVGAKAGPLETGNQPPGETSTGSATGGGVDSNGNDTGTAPMDVEPENTETITSDKPDNMDVAVEERDLLSENGGNEKSAPSGESRLEQSAASPAVVSAAENDAMAVDRESLGGTDSHPMGGLDVLSALAAASEAKPTTGMQEGELHANEPTEESTGVNGNSRNITGESGIVGGGSEASAKTETGDTEMDDAEVEAGEEESTDEAANEGVSAISGDNQASVSEDTPMAGATTADSETNPDQRIEDGGEADGSIEKAPGDDRTSEGGLSPTAEEPKAEPEIDDKAHISKNATSSAGGVTPVTEKRDTQPEVDGTAEASKESSAGGATPAAPAVSASKPKVDDTANTSADRTAADDRASVDGAAPAAAPAPSPPPPVLKGTLSYNVEQRRHIIRGMWNYENSNAFPAQRFELIRNLDNGEDVTVLPKDGEFHGSFSLAYYHTTSKGKQKERSKVIPESGVKIIFTKVEGKEKEFKVDGEGTNQFGIFYINGTASPSEHEGDPSYTIELRKRYKPTPVSAQPAVPVPMATASGQKKSKKSKKRKHDHVGTQPGDEDSAATGQADTDEDPLPPPSQSHPSHVICLRGKLTREESKDLGVTEVVHRINGMWSSGLDLIVADPQNLRGLCNRFEYEHKMSLSSDVFPLSGRYTGWFDLTQQDGARTRISERDVTLKFRKNNAGYYNVEGRGSNSFGKYRITGTLSADNVLTIFRHFQPLKSKKQDGSSSKASGSVTAAPPPLQTGRASKQHAAQVPTHPRLSLDDVVIPDDGKSDELPKPIPLPAHGTYSAVSRGVLRLHMDDGAHTCSGKWAMTREHFNNGSTSSFNFRLEKHFAEEAAKVMIEAKRSENGSENDVDKIFPVDAAMYKGSFQMRRGATKYQTIIDHQIVLKFRKNSAGSYNVHGKGINNIGVFTLIGTFVESGKNGGHIDLYRMYPVVPKPAPGPASAGANKAASSGKSAVAQKRSAVKDGSAVSGGAVAGKSADGTAPTGASLLAGPRPSALQRRESSRLVKLPSRLEDDDPEAQMVRIMEKCVGILTFMHEKDVASGAFFSEPVDPLALGIPTYYDIISEPMDLGTVKKKMDANEIKSPEEFARLVRLVFENAMTFNIEPTHAVHQAGRNLLILFNQKFRDVERMVENIRRYHKPSEADLRNAEKERKRKEKEESKKAKKRAKDERKRKLSGGADPRASKKTRLEEAQAMATANASSMAAIRAAAPHNAGNVTRVEFNMMLQMMQLLQGQVVQLHTLLANAASDDVGDNVGIASADSSYAALSDSPYSTGVQDKKRTTKKKCAPKVAERVEVPSYEELKPLTLKEQEILTETINELESDRLQGVIDIIREAATLNGDEDEIDLEIEELDTATQRRLQKFVQKNVKQPRRSKVKSPKKSKASAASRQTQPKKRGGAPASKAKSATPKAAVNSFFAFGSKGDSDSESDSESDGGEATTKNQKGAATAEEEFNLGDGFGASLQDDEDEEMGNGGLAANWNISKPAAQSAASDGGDDASDGLWGAAREKAAATKAREAERKALEDKVIADAEIAKDRRLAEAAARGDEIRMQREEEEAKEAALREQQEQEAEEARKAARDAARAQVQGVVQTVDLDAERDIMREYEQSFFDKEMGGSASPSSDFGF